MPDHGIVDRAVELVARSLWWDQEIPEYPPDHERWRAAALTLPSGEFGERLAREEEAARQ